MNAYLIDEIQVLRRKVADLEEKVAELTELYQHMYAAQEGDYR